MARGAGLQRRYPILGWPNPLAFLPPETRASPAAPMPTFQVENLTSFRTPDLHFPPSVAPLRKVSEMTLKRVSEYFPKCVSDFAEIRR